jgi:hypothetical protein
MKRIFGIKTILVNGYQIYTYCLSFKLTAYNEQLFKDNNLPYQLTHKNKLLVSFTTSDPLLFNAEVKKLGKCCKAIALNNIADKYIWVIE